ncbi:MAG: hypothetical protein GKS06_00005 [Acidobacteria bacterium]|nr:hypothetical protein [Acidobacteriota bacterium]
MALSPDVVSILTGILVGWILSRALREHPRFATRAITLTASIVLWTAWRSGINGVEDLAVSYVERVTESGAFAVGALVGFLYSDHRAGERRRS